MPAALRGREGAAPDPAEHDDHDRQHTACRRDFTSCQRLFPGFRRRRRRRRRADQHRRHGVADEQQRKDKSGYDAGDEQLSDRLLGDDPPDNQEHARGDQHAKARRTGDRTEGELALVAKPGHFGIGDPAEGRSRGYRGSGHRGEGGIAGDGRNRKATGNAA